MRYLLIILSFWWAFSGLQAQYTLERHHIGASGGAQSNSSYSVTSAMHAYQARTIQNSSLNGNTGFLFPERHTLPPVITQVIDVPNDQGKQVHVNWDKSDYDKNYDPDKFYSVWRQDDDGQDYGTSFSNPLDVIQNATNEADNFNWTYKGMIWSYIDTIPALGFDNYSLVAPTLFDSIAGDPGLSTFMVVFHDQNAFYESEAQQGYSVDNLAPNAPVLDAILVNQSAELNWTESTAEDFQYYAIYKSDTEANFPTEAFSTSIANNYLDADLTFDTTYYRVTAFDFNGNESEFSNMAMVPLHSDFELDIKVFLEGPFENGSMVANLNSILPLSQPYGPSPWYYNGLENVAAIPLSNIVDWVLVELRDAPDAPSATPATTVDKQAAFLLNDGSLVGLDGSSILTFDHTIIHSLFVVIWHRNHLPIMTANPLTQVDGTYEYNFKFDGMSAYGTDAQKNLGTNMYGMYAADPNADGNINLSDKTIWTNQAGTQGYVPTDFNMDGQVNNADKNDKWLPNEGEESQVPE